MVQPTTLGAYSLNCSHRVHQTSRPSSAQCRGRSLHNLCFAVECRCYAQYIEFNQNLLVGYVMPLGHSSHSSFFFTFSFYCR